jgi:nicotinamidase-related amidase
MKLDPQKTAVLALDYQQGILGMVTGSEAVVGTASKVIETARKKKFKIIHVGLGFDQGHPEIPNTQISFSRLKENNLFVKGTASAEFASVLVKPEDLIVYKQRVSAFSENQLHMILRAQGIENLILMGVATSGIVLSTLRRAFDLDYHCVVIQDACFDRDAEVHRVLTEKVFTHQATVMTADKFVSEHG